jgi:hypothetical protein
MNDRLILAALSAGWLLLTPPISAHEPMLVDPEAGERVSGAIAADQRFRAQEEKQERLGREQQNREQSGEDGRYYWWWPFRR